MNIQFGMMEQCVEKAGESEARCFKSNNKTSIDGKSKSVAFANIKYGDDTHYRLCVSLESNEDEVESLEHSESCRKN